MRDEYDSPKKCRSLACDSTGRITSLLQTDDEQRLRAVDRQRLWNIANRVELLEYIARSASNRRRHARSAYVRSFISCSQYKHSSLQLPSSCTTCPFSQRLFHHTALSRATTQSLHQETTKDASSMRTKHICKPNCTQSLRQTFPRVYRKTCGDLSPFILLMRVYKLIHNNTGTKLPYKNCTIRVRSSRQSNALTLVILCVSIK